MVITQQCYYGTVIYKVRSVHSTMSDKRSKAYLRFPEASKYWLYIYPTSALHLHRMKYFTQNFILCLVLICFQKFGVLFTPCCYLLLLHATLQIFFISLLILHYTGWAKKLHTGFIAVTLSTVNQFSYFLHIYTIWNLQLDDA